MTSSTTWRASLQYSASNPVNFTWHLYVGKNSVDFDTRLDDFYSVRSIKSLQSMKPASREMLAKDQAQDRLVINYEDDWFLLKIFGIAHKFPRQH